MRRVVLSSRGLQSSWLESQREREKTFKRWIRAENQRPSLEERGRGSLAIESADCLYPDFGAESETAQSIVVIPNCVDC